jgi:hypothetical protein
MKDDTSSNLPGDLETLRRKALDKVRALQRENAPRVGDRYWTSPTGYNYGWWGDKGFRIALGLLQDTPPHAGEAGPDFLRRVVDLVRAQRDEYRADAADEDGACSGALDAAVWAIIDVLPAEAPPPEPSDPAPDAAWEVWYRDLFDRETPLMMDVRGHGLLQGLTELWARVLFETVRPGGGRGFSRFHLRWNQRQAVKVEGPWEGATRLREWVFGAQEHTSRGYVAAGDTQLLERVAFTHATLLLAGRSAEPILAAAATCADRPEFEGQLAALVR